MASIGILSRDVITKNRVLEALEDQGHEVAILHTTAFDDSVFDTIMVDLNDPTAMLVIKSHGYKCVAFGSANDEDKLRAAKMSGCKGVYKHGEFFKKILPKFK